jgi:hypothetical protein
MLKNVYTSNNVNNEQLEMLKMLRASMNISEDIHKKLESEIKHELMDPSGSSNSSENLLGNDLHLMIQDPPAVAGPTSVVDQGSEVVQQEVIEAIEKTETEISKALLDVKIKKYITLGKEKYRKKDYEAALKLFSDGLGIMPDHEELGFLMKKVKLKLKTGDNGHDTKTLEQGPVTATDSTATQTPPRAAIPMNGSTVSASELSEVPSAIPIPLAVDPQDNVSDSNNDLGLLDTDSECISCEGHGICYWCNGTGKCDRCGGTGSFHDETCSMCGGSGKCNSCSGNGSCPWCKGSGSRSVRKLLKS